MVYLLGVGVVMRSNYNLTNVTEKETFGLLSTCVKDIGPRNL